jgi:hypothetical protein
VRREQPARIHLLPAKKAPIVCIIRRKPSKCFHVIKWNTSTDEMEHGSWFHGKLYPLRCDVSFDGQWMVYLAMGAGGNTWNGICNPPWLKTVCDAPNMGTWGGGGYWKRQDSLLMSSWEPKTAPPGLPFRIGPNRSRYGEDQGVLYPRLERDGWRRAGEFGEERRLANPKKLMVVCENDPGWFWKPTSTHPTLRVYYRGYLDHGYTFEFALDEHPGLLDRSVEWATWDSLGQLVFARAGRVARYGLEDFAYGRPSFEQDLEALAPPRPEGA